MYLSSIEYVLVFILKVLISVISSVKYNFKQFLNLKPCFSSFKPLIICQKNQLQITGKCSYNFLYCKFSNDHEPIILDQEINLMKDEFGKEK